MLREAKSNVATFSVDGIRPREGFRCLLWEIVHTTCAVEMERRCGPRAVTTVNASSRPDIECTKDIEWQLVFKSEEIIHQTQISFLLVLL